MQRRGPNDETEAQEGTVRRTGGRVFCIEDVTPPCFYGVKAKWLLTARDAFSGALLWRRPVEEWYFDAWPGRLGGWAYGPSDHRQRLVAAGDRTYVTLGRNAPVSALDAATGRTLRTYGEARDHVEILHDRGTLFVASGSGRRPQYRIAAYDAATGRRNWEAAGGHGIAAAEGRVYFLAADGTVGAVDAATGRHLWSASPLERLGGRRADRRKGPRLQGPIRAGEGVVLVCPGNRSAVVALSADTGEFLWVRVHGGRSWYIPVSAHIIRGLVWMTGKGDAKGEVAGRVLALGLDPKSGEVRKTVPCGQIWNAGHHGRCFPAKATTRHLILKQRGTDFLDLGTGEVTLNNWVRPACSHGLVPCNGLLYFPPHSCRCYSEAGLRGLSALAPARSEALPSHHETARSRLERGPAYAELSPARREIGTSRPGDWPTYRHDPMRSGATRSTVPVHGGTPSRPTRMPRGG